MKSVNYLVMELSKEIVKALKKESSGRACVCRGPGEGCCYRSLRFAGRDFYPVAIGICA